MKKSLFILSVIALMCNCSKNNTQKPHEMPDTTYTLAKQELNVSYGSDPKQKMDIYFPGGYNKNTPVVFVLHGGGFMAGDKSGFTDVAKLFMARGYITVNVGYRLVDGSVLIVHKQSAIKGGDQVNDIAAAVEKFKAMANFWNVGTSKMYMAGHSAGGNLAMMYVQSKKNKNVRASGNFGGTVTVAFPEEFYDNPPRHILWPAFKEALYRLSGSEYTRENRKVYMELSAKYISADNKPGKPNISVMPKSNDKDLHFAPYYNSVKDAEEYHNQLQSYGTVSNFVIMETNHGFDKNKDDWKRAVDLAAKFFWKI